MVEACRIENTQMNGAWASLLPSFLDFNWAFKSRSGCLTFFFFLVTIVFKPMAFAYDGCSCH